MNAVALVTGRTPALATPLELDLNARVNVELTLSELAKRGRFDGSISLLRMPNGGPYREFVLTAAGS